MSQISKAVEIAKREGHFFQTSLKGDEASRAGEFNFAIANKLEASKSLLKKNRVLSAIDDQMIVDSYRLLRTRVLRRMQQNKWKSIGITSAGKNAGKTLTAVNLGISIALKQNYTVVIVDTDLRNPSLHKLFGFKPKVGLKDYLTSTVSVDNLLIQPDIERLVILPGTNSTEDSSELLSSPKMSRLTQELKTRYPSRIVIYDLPPVLVGDDVVAFAPNIDAALLVVEVGSTETEKLKQTIDLLEGIEIIGTVLNKSKEYHHDHEYYY